MELPRSIGRIKASSGDIADSDGNLSAFLGWGVGGEPGRCLV